jgi:multidrug efflux system membrane fusion protein
VNVVVAGGKVETRPVSTGDDRNGRTVITKGLKVGDTVIVEGQDRLQPGATVKPSPWRHDAAKR